MTPQALKASLLQRAIQGKLVEQRPEDGTADALSTQIQAEKAALIKAGKLKKDKPLPEITADELPFDIPSSWKWVRLGEVCTKIVDGDHNPPKGEAFPTKYWMLSAQNINNNQLVNLDQVRYLSEDVFRSVNERTSACRGDILFTIVGTLGRSCVYQGGYNVCFQRSVSVLTSLIYNYYLKYVLDSAYVQNFMTVNATGTAQKGFYLNQVSRLLIPLPPLAEQKRIVEKIERLLPLVERYEAAWERLNAFNKRFPADLQKSLLQMAIQGKLVEQRPEEGTAEALYTQIQAEKAALIKAGKLKKDKPLPEITADELPFDIPPTWKWVRLGECGSWASGATPSRHNPEFYGGEIPWLKTGDLNDGYVIDIPETITSLALSKTSVRLNPVGSVLIAMYGATIGKVGILGVPATTNQACCACIPYEGLWNKYLFYFLRANKKAFIKMGEGGAQPNISKEKIVKALIPLPPLAEQQRIVERLEQLLALTQQLC